MKQAEFLSAVEKYQNMVYRISLHWFGNPHDAEDVVQETFLRLYRQERSFESDEHLRRWLMRTAVNLCKDTLKSPWRKRRVALEQIPDQPVFDRPEEGALYREVMELPVQYRTVLNLYYYEDLSTKEIAELLHLRQTAVTTRLSRARALLKDRLGEDWNDDE